MFKQRNHEIVRSLDDAEVLCLTGGADIDPNLYGEAPMAGTYFNRSRDDFEVRCFERAQELGLFIFGICRGGQLANVLSGGKLWQHIEGHPYEHTIQDVETGQSIISSSIHHQMFRPAPDAVIVATCNHATFKVAEHDRWQSTTDGSNDDVEVCWYPKTRSLCIQGHPEVGPDAFTDYSFELMERYY